MEIQAMRYRHIPKSQGLYEPSFEHDSCGVGFVCNIKGEQSHSIIRDGIKVLERLSHRGAVGADPDTGDGAGILIQIPHLFFKNVCNGIDIPDLGKYGAGLVFLPKDLSERSFCMKAIEKAALTEGQRVLGFRDVPVDIGSIGKGAREAAPFMSHVFIERSESIKAQIDFERKLYVIRKKSENAVAASSINQKKAFYITNISSRTLCYKGLLMPGQLSGFFHDLSDELMRSSICLVHSRYSTNTFPTWDLAQPFRFLAHNGEINTIRGNINWMRARERILSSDLFQSDIEKIKPIINEGGSDSACIDNVFELLTLSGRPLAHCMMMLIPAAWEQDHSMPAALRDFYEFHACFMEPWDGPAAIAFTDGVSIGATLDRNGLRPARYIVTEDDMVVMASEAGVLDIEPSKIIFSGRLEPGKILFIDTEKGLVVSDNDIKKSIASAYPYGKWIKDNMVALKDLSPSEPDKGNFENILLTLKAFGYTREDMNFILKPMFEDGKEPIGSMGNDIPHACLSNKPQLLYNYFKQLFAQVTNPAIDPIRERIVMSLESFIGPERNILDNDPMHSRKLKVYNPILSLEELSKIKEISLNGFSAKTIYTFFDISAGTEGFIDSLERICFESEYAIDKGYPFIILSDRGTSCTNVSLPALLAMSAVHQHLVDKGIRSQVSIIVESAEPREVHHIALLFGYGADCVCPYLVYEVINFMIAEGLLSIDAKNAQKNYIKAIKDGILKILSKMGISTLRSYRGAQIFEALGLSDEFIERYFKGTISRIGGLGTADIAEETIKRHRIAYPERQAKPCILNSGGVYQWKRDGEFHLWNPNTIASLQDAARHNDISRYREFADFINNQNDNPTTIRSLFRFKKQTPVSIEDVEPAESIMTRFATGAMSFGSISGLAHETIAIAMNRIGAKSNTGEGGEDPNRFIPLPNGDLKRSSIKQIASGRFGVTTNYLVNADEIQIKIAQGAKPGEGGQLPGHKVSDIIARTRYTTPGVTLISPPPHHDIYSIEDLAQLIFDLKNVNPRARISVKLVSEIGVGTVAAGVAKAHADMILISGGDGGTGASPRSSIRYAGLPWELGLSETHQTLLLNGLRQRVSLQADGQMRTGRDIAIATLLGAQEYGICTAVLIVMGCVMLRHCHLNNCSVGIATQDPILQKRFKADPAHIVNYIRFIVQELREIMASLGLKTIDSMLGRSDLLEKRSDMEHFKSKFIDASRIFYRPEHETLIPAQTFKKPFDGQGTLDAKLIKIFDKSLKESYPVMIDETINNTDRSTGAMLSGHICRKYGDGVLIEDSIRCRFRGVAGQSFGAFLVKGVTFELEGMANDYTGKGISGGKIIVYPDRGSTLVPEQSIVVGNTSFYGAISGEAYIRGIAGERFCIRNSGLYAVVEGLGDHGCEYMTGGRVLVLGGIGRNFAAGMSGGIAYVSKKCGKLKDKCNMDMVLIEDLTEDDVDTFCYLVRNHYKYTKSTLAKSIIDNIKDGIAMFARVIPIEYKRILDSKKLEKILDRTQPSDG
jgi:glutamate synthase (NADPH) large chain